MSNTTNNINLNFAKAKNVGNPVLQSTLLIIILLVFSWFLLRPKLSQYFTTRANVQSAQTQLSKVESEQKQLDTLVSQLKSSPDDVKLVDEALPLSGRITKVDVLLNSMVQSSGMTLTVLSSNDTQSIVSAGDKQILQNPFQPGRTLHTITINASVSGTMEQLKNLLQLMETNGRVLDVDSLEIVGGDPVTKFKLTVKAYAYDKLDQQKTNQ